MSNSRMPRTLAWVRTNVARALYSELCAVMRRPRRSVLPCDFC